MLSAPSPRIESMMLPPSVLCLKISIGSAGNRPGSLVAVSCEPITSAAMEAAIPTIGPAKEMSKSASLFFGGVLNCVTELVIPVISEGTNVGSVISTCVKRSRKEREFQRQGKNRCTQIGPQPTSFREAAMRWPIS